VVNSAVEKIFAKVNDSIDAKIDTAMKNILGAGTVGSKPASPASGMTVPVNDGFENEDASYLVRGVFGNR
jgi:hypothetical protein